MKKLCAFLSVLIGACVLLSGCNKSPLCAYTTYAYFNTQTRWAFFLRSAEREKQVWQEIAAVAQSVEKSVSLAEDDSAISRFNRAAAGEKVALDAAAYDLLRIAQNAYVFTHGAYNPAVGIYIDLWGFSPRCTSVNYAPECAYDRADYTAQLPDEAYVEAFRSLTDFSAVELGEDEGGYYAIKPDCVAVVDGVSYTMQLNLGGIAKGYCADECEPLVRGAGYETGYLSFGVSSLLVLRNEGGDAVNGNEWAVGVNSPREQLGKQFMSLYLKDIALSSSGDGELFYEIEGLRYCHIIDPETGYPVNVRGGGNGVIYAAVSGLSGAMGDAVTTALHVMGKDKAIAFAQNELAECGVSFVYADESGFTLYTNLHAGTYRLFTDHITVVNI